MVSLCLLSPKNALFSMLIPTDELKLLCMHSIDVRFNPPISIGPFIFDTFMRPLLIIWFSSLAQNVLFIYVSSLSSCFGNSGIDKMLIKSDNILYYQMVSYMKL